MKTDSIFYRLFKTFPEAFFELINSEAAETTAYDFASVELKQTAFRIDGVFLPVPIERKKPIYFLEVQFQKECRIVCPIILRTFSLSASLRTNQSLAGSRYFCQT
jgi:predicted transposase/invertase (TIGR01784 family)